ncbi:glycosyltransferase, partial [Escherichia coli]
ARVVSLDDPDGMAATLGRLAGSSVERARASTEARRLGRERFNWDFEKSFLLKSVARAFETRRGVG